MNKLCIRESAKPSSFSIIQHSEQEEQENSLDPDNFVFNPNLRI